jgi:hypothetical protein
MTEAFQPTTPEAATARLTELSSNTDWSSKVLAKDPTVFAEFQSLTKVIATPPPPAAGTAEAMALETSRTNDARMLNEFLAATAGKDGFPDPKSAIGKDLVEMLNGKSISQELHDAVQAKLDSMLKDKDFVTRFENREQRAMLDWQCATHLLAANIMEKN